MEKTPRKIEKINSWPALLKVFDTNSQSRKIWRGESSDKHQLIPSIGRSRKTGLIYSPSIERRLLDNFKRRLPALNQNNVADDWDALAFAQHVGVPTRLLDWSLNPFVAVFFALQSTKKSDRVLYVFSIDDVGNFEDRATTSPLEVQDVVAFIPAHFHPRIMAQRAIFTVHSDPRKEFKPASLQRYIIDANAVVTLRRRLFRYGTDFWAIYPDAEGIGLQLKWQFNHGVKMLG